MKTALLAMPIGLSVKPLLHPIVRACTSWLQRKIAWFAKGPSRHTCDFITESQGRTDPAIEIDMNIFSACTQCVHWYWSSELL